MLWQNAIHAVALTAALLMTIGGAQAFDDAMYPDWKGQWSGRGGGVVREPIYVHTTPPRS